MDMTYDEYMNAKTEFLKKHGRAYTVSTTPMENDCWGKTYVLNDGAMWYESYSPVYEEIESEVHYVKVHTSVKLLRTEFWNTDNSKTYRYYERY